jgi:hypothetical protein
MDEIDRYKAVCCREPPPPKTDPLHWWHQRAQQYSRLAVAA